MRLRHVSLKPMHIALIIASLLYLIAGTASGAPAASRGALDLHLADAALLAARPAPSATPAAAAVTAAVTAPAPAADAAVAIAVPAVIYPTPASRVRREPPRPRERYGSDHPGTAVLLPIVAAFF